jgi:hypothetical protein
VKKRNRWGRIGEEICPKDFTFAKKWNRWMEGIGKFDFGFAKK